MSQAKRLAGLVPLMAGLGMNWCSAVAADSAAVFMYHRFDEAQHPSTSISRAHFERQLELLQSEGMAVVPLARLVAFLRGEQALPERAVVITVDDAYRSVATVGHPILAGFGYPYTVFVASGPVDAGLGGYMGWGEMRRLAGEGVTFANHGADHLHLADRLQGESEIAWRRRVTADLEQGAARLDAELGETGAVLERVFAYPYGEFDAPLAGLVEARGWLAFGQQSGAIGRLSDQRALPRFPIAEAFADADEFRVKALTLPLPVTRVSPWDPVTPEVRPNVEFSLEASADGWRGLACFVSGQGQVPLDWLERGRRFRVGPQAPFAPGRHRVNCTAPGPDGRFFWFSHPWLIKAGDEVTR